MRRARIVLAWAALALAALAPVAVALGSPLLAFRGPLYIAAGLAGVAGLSVMLLQPVLAAGLLPGLDTRVGRRVHRVTGAVLIGLVLLHVVGLWITSPPDMVDALLFRSPTPFSAWGVVAMWAIFAVGLLALLRDHLRPRIWRLAHTALLAPILAGTVVHAWLIDGTMGTVSKALLSALVILAAGAAVARLRVWRVIRRPV